MRRLWTVLRRLTPLAQGFLGCVLALVLYVAGTWTLARYREFVELRDVMPKVIQAINKLQPRTP